MKGAAGGKYGKIPQPVRKGRTTGSTRAHGAQASRSLGLGAGRPRWLRGSGQGSQAGFTETVGKLRSNLREDGGIDTERGTPAALLLLAAETCAAARALLLDV